jgi:thiol-disulfide isomerase/thioredoxin
MKYYQLKTILIFTSILSFGQLLAQQGQLRPGDQLPDLHLRDIRQHHQIYNAKVSDFKGQLLILDFWATTCGACVGALPKLDTLKKTFGNQIEILGVSTETDAVVKRCYEKLYTKNKIRPASVTGDTVLRKLFSYHWVPYYVWVSPQGKVLAITEGDQLTEKNIRMVLTGRADHLVQLKIDPREFPRELAPNLPVFMLSNPFLAEDKTILREVDPKKIKFQSIFGSYIPNLRGGMKWDSTTFNATNTALSFFFKFVHAVTTEQKLSTMFFRDGRFAMEVSDPKIKNQITSQLSGQKFIEWLKPNGICYELQWANAKDWKTRYQMLLEDVERYICKPMGIVSEIQKRPVTAYVLKRIGPDSSLRTKGGGTEVSYSKGVYRIKNDQIHRLIQFLDRRINPMLDKHFFDETGITWPVDIEIKGKLSDMTILNQELLPFGLIFIKAERKADVLVIRDR